MKKSIYIVLGLLLAVACTKNFENINTNPNQLSEANPEYLFNTSVYQTLYASCGPIKKIALDNYVQYNYGQTNQFGRYGNVTTTNSDYFKRFYNNALLPTQFIIDKKGDSEEYANRVLIARIWQAYIYSQVAAIWGPIPMSKALEGDITVPYDDEPTVYHKIFDELKYCVDNINPEGDVYFSDPVFKTSKGASDLSKWVKFANSLRLRLAVRVCNADKALAQETLSEVMASENLTMESNDDNCVVHWGADEKTRNYYYDYFIVQTENRDKSNAAGENFLMYTAPYGDPRLPKFFTECTSAKMPENFHWAPYWGMPKSSDTPVSGLIDGANPHGGTPATSYSVMQEDFFAESYGQTFLSYAEVELLKAEAVHLGLCSGNKGVEEYYNAGIRASMAQFGVTSADAIQYYMSTDGIELGVATDLESTEEGAAYYKDYLGLCSSIIYDNEADMEYHQIIMQQYIALFNQALDAWTLLRRSQVLDMIPHYNPETGYGAVNAGTPDVEFAYLPQRFMFPSSEYTDNNEEVTKAASFLTGGDAIDTVLWWAKPTRKNAELERLVETYNK